MSSTNNITLGINTAVISMGIVFLVLIALSIIVSIQYRLLKMLGIIADRIEKSDEAVGVKDEKKDHQKMQAPVHSGPARGEALLIGVEDEELVAAIMAAVSITSNIYVSSLRIRSIKRVDNNWTNVSRQEMANQRL